MTASSPILATYDLVHCYGSKRALDGLTIELPPGHIHAIVGANGSGKSTLFRILLGFQTPTCGEAYLLGQSSSTLTPEQRGNIGYVNDAHTLPLWMRLDALVAMQSRLYPLWNEAVFRDVLGYFAVSLQSKVRELSRGERAGFNLALALAQRPKLLILDEPTLGLDVVAKRAFMEALIHTAHADDCTIIYCSHQMEEIERLADTLVMLERGRLVNMSAPDDFTARVQLWIADMPFKGPDPSSIPGLLQIQRLDGLFHYTVLDQGDRFASWLREKGALNFRPQAVNLDQAVSAFLAAGHAMPN